MKNILLIYVVVFVNNMNALDFSQRGRILGYNPPPPPPESYRRLSAAIIEERFIQKLDHFDPTSGDTWSQRYFVNTEYFHTTKRNVAFLMIGPEAASSIGWMNYGSWIVSAKKYNALLFQLEHRFYGDSQPFPDVSFKNLRYLSSQQALADLANFIVAMNEKYQLSSDIKWILFGGSYAGALAAWMREKYPHLVHGAISSSGPLFAKLDFHEYFQVVADDLADSSQECVDTVKVAMKQVEELLNSPDVKNLTDIFNLCSPIEEDLNNPWDLAYFSQIITVPFAAAAQYSNIPGITFTTNDLCDILTNNAYGTEIYRLGVVNSFYYGTNCLNYHYDDVIEYLKDTDVELLGERQWYYQTCTEFGWYQTTNQKDQVFGNRVHLDFFTRICKDVYSETFNESFISEQIERTNMDYGGLNIATSNIVYVHGSYDPWHPVGIVKSTNPKSSVILINGTTHCADLYEEAANDLPQLIATREEIDRLIGVWLGVN